VRISTLNDLYFISHPSNTFHCETQVSLFSTNFFIKTLDKNTREQAPKVTKKDARW